jgi:hypothetical protein
LPPRRLLVYFILCVGLLGLPSGRALAPGIPVTGDNEPAALTPRQYLPTVQRSAHVDLRVTRVEVIQGITMDDARTAHVANRPATLRAFLGLTGEASLGSVRGRLTRYVGGTAQDSLNAGPITLPAAVSEGSLGHTLNFNLPAHWLTPGTGYVLQVDPANAIGETTEGNNRYPAAGVQAFNFQAAPALDVVIVPVTYDRAGAPPTTPNTSNLGYLTWMPIKVLPLATINYTVRATPLLFTRDLQVSDNWIRLAEAIQAIHANEDPLQHKLYYGLVDTQAVDGCNPSCVIGIGYISSPGAVYKSSAGFAGFPGDAASASPTFTHEMGHNFGRRHAPCGSVSSYDTGFPYGGAIIGQWGYEAGTSILYAPTGYRDYMSYCHEQWTSDYTYFNIFQAWSWVDEPYGAAAAVESADSLVVAGHIAPDGTAALGTAFFGPAVPPSTSGPYELALLDAAGGVLAAVTFDTAPLIVDGLEDELRAESFYVSLPAHADAAGLRLSREGRLLAERAVSGPAPDLAAPRASLAGDAAQAEWSLSTGAGAVSFRVRLSPDGGATWHVLALDTDEPAVAVPPELLKDAPAPLLEIQASDGVRVDREFVPLPPR